MTDIATVFKSLLDSSIPRYARYARYGRQFLGFARVTDIATVLKSLLDSSIPRQSLDMLDMLNSF